MYQQRSSRPKYINPYIPTLNGSLRIPVDCIAWERKITTGENTGQTYINYFDFETKEWNRVITTWSLQDINDAKAGN